MPKEIRRHQDGIWYTCRPVDSGVWYIFWSEQRRSRRESTGAKTVAEASAYFDEFLALKAAGPAGQRFSCRDLFGLKYDMAAERARRAWTLHLEPAFGDMTPQDVTQAAVDRYVTKRRKVATASTVRFEVACLVASWNWAANKKRKLLNPAEVPAIELPEASPPRERWLRDEEIDKLFEAARGHDRVLLFLHLALDTAARRTAICELTWEQVDWEADDGEGVIHYLPEGREQTRKRRASVPMSRRLRAVLWDAYGKRKNGWVLGSPAHINRSLAQVVKKAGVPGVTPHVLRHTAATHMARRGVSLWIIAHVLGNSLDQVEKVYAKYQPGFARAAVESIGGAWGRGAPELKIVKGEK